jgi:hypothetical protein
MRWMVLAAVLMLSACSGGDSPTGTKAGAGAEDNAAPDACAVVTAADVEQVLGVPASVQPSDQLKSIATTALCSYESADGARNLVSVLVRVGPPSLDAQTNLKQYVDGIKTNMGDAYQVESVEGLSGPAVWNPDMKQLTVFKGSTLAIVTVFGEGDGDLLTPARTLAERALAKL